MSLAVGDRQLRIPFAVGTVHRLKKEMPEIQVFEPLGLRLFLRVDELEFIAAVKDDRRICLGAHADPIQPLRRGLRAIRFDGHLKSLGMQCVDQWLVELKQWLSSRADDETCSGSIPFWPARGNGSCQFAGGCELSATLAVRSDKLGIAERADGLRPVLLHSGPQVASGEPAENSRPPGLHSFTLKRVENLFDAVSHGSDRKCRVVGAPGENGATTTSLEKVDAIQLRQVG